MMLMAMMMMMIMMMAIMMGIVMILMMMIMMMMMMMMDMVMMMMVMMIMVIIPPSQHISSAAVRICSSKAVLTKGQSSSSVSPLTSSGIAVGRLLFA
jgi:hypothetical protein